MQEMWDVLWEDMINIYFELIIIILNEVQTMSYDNIKSLHPHDLIDKTDRERDFHYANINLKLYPGYHIVRRGMGSFIYTDEGNKHVGELFLDWDNKDVLVSVEMIDKIRDRLDCYNVKVKPW